MFVVVFCLHVLSLVWLASGQGPNGSFVNPPDQSKGNSNPSENPVYAVGDALEISWYSTGSQVMTIAIWNTVGDTGADTGDAQYLPGSVAIMGTNTLLWNIGVNGGNGQPLFDLTKGNIFHLGLYGDDDTILLSSTTSFNLTDSTVAANGSILSTSTSTPTSSTTSTTAPSTSQSNNSNSTAVPSSGGLGNGGKIAVGVGIGVGLPLLLAVIAGIYFMAKLLNNGVSKTTSYKWAARWERAPFVDQPPLAELPTPG